MPSAEEDLWDSCTTGDLSQVTSLLNLPGINVNYADPTHRRTCFFRSCGNGHHQIVRLLLQDHRIDVNQPMNDGATPFLIACAQGKWEVVRLLLQDDRIHVNQAQRDGTTPFHIACREGHSEVVRLLLQDDRINVSQADNHGFAPFYVACQYGQLEVVRLLSQDDRINVSQAKNDGATPFYIACQFGHSEVVRLLSQDHRINVNQAKNDGRTPFSIACQFGRIDLVKIFIASGRNLDFLKKLSKATAERNDQSDDDDAERETVKPRKGSQEIISLLESFNKDPIETRRRLRIELKWSTKCGKMLSLASLLCDGYLKLKSEELDSKVERFFKIFRELHLDAQMVLINRSQGVKDDSILQDDQFFSLNWLLESLRSS